MNNILFKIYILFVILYDGVTSSFQYWKNEIKDRDLDERVCCDGSMCGCGGVTIREQWTKSGRVFSEESGESVENPCINCGKGWDAVNIWPCPHCGNEIPF